MQEKKKHNIRTIVAICLACLLLLSTADLVFSAKAAETEEPSGGVYQALLQIKAVYPDQYFYFTRSGSACYSSSGSDCLLTNIPSRGGLPSGAEVGYSAWSCVGFAHYVFYCVFGTTFKSGTVVSTPSVGDVIHTTGPGSNHHSVYLGEDSANWYVFDGNWGNACGVRWYGKISKSTCTLHEIYHAKNYDAVNGSSVSLNLTAPAEETTTTLFSAGSEEETATRSFRYSEDTTRPSFASAELSLKEDAAEETTERVSGRTPPEKPGKGSGRDRFSSSASSEATNAVGYAIEPAPGEIPDTKLEQIESALEGYLPGDVNLDGAVTAADARIALRAAVNLETEIIGVMFNNCDMDGNDAITAYDARLILRTAVGL